MADTDVRIPKGIIEAYERARRVHISYEETTWTREPLIFVPYLRALDHIVQAATNDSSDIKRAAIERAYASLDRILADCGEASSVNADLSDTEVRLPEDITWLYKLASIGFWRYFEAIEEGDFPALHRFRDVLDHITRVGQLEIASISVIEELANAKEHLKEIAVESPERATRTLLNRIRRVGHSIFYRQTTWLWRDSPSLEFIDATLETVAHLLAEARVLKGDIRAVNRCASMMQQALDEARKLHLKVSQHYLQQRLFDEWEKKALIDSGWKPNAHHIVPKDFRGHPEYGDLIDELDALWGGRGQFDLHSAFNGVMLPEKIHVGAHRKDEYLDIVYQRLKNIAVGPNPTKDEVIQEIAIMRNEILNGDLKLNLNWVDPKLKQENQKFFDAIRNSKHIYD